MVHATGEGAIRGKRHRQGTISVWKHNSKEDAKFIRARLKGHSRGKEKIPTQATSQLTMYFKQNRSATEGCRNPKRGESPRGEWNVQMPSKRPMSRDV